MARTRLTQRIASKEVKAESQADGLFPGDVGNMERAKNYHDIDEYHTFEQTVNHELPDMRHEWKDNPRTTTGHGIPKMASVFIAAKKATKLAMMLLGENATDSMIEAQAKDFMRMGNKALTASVNRWAEIVENEQNAEEAAPAEEPAAPVAEEKVEEAPAAPVAAEEVTAPAVEETPAEAPVACDTCAEDETDVIGDEEEVGDIELDENANAPEVEFDEAEEGEVEADPELEALFEGDGEGEETTAPVGTPVASKKAGIKRLAGQPKLVRVASKKDANELSGLWEKWENPNLR